MAESISIEETNALREKLGLPPLAAQDSDDEVVDPEKEAYDNYQKMKQEQEKAKRAEEIKKNIEKSQNRKRNLSKLQGKGLGEASDDEDDSALNWVKKSRTRERDLAARRAREIEEMDNTFQSGQYDASHLSGLKVGHSLSEFDEVGETILTLKDRSILDEQDEDADELTNVNIEDKERVKKNLETKKKKPGYNPYDDDQFNGSKQSILPQYEEEEGIEGFVIGASGTVSSKDKDQAENQKTVSEKLKEQTLSYTKMQEIKDYYTQEEIEATFKKPKSKKKKMRRKAKEENEDFSAAAASANATSESRPTIARVRNHEEDANFVDDDDLQEALSRARRVANKQKNKLIKKMTPEEIAKQIKEEEANQMKIEEDDESGGLVLSETSEFVGSLGINIPSFINNEPKPQQVKKEPETPTIKEEPVYEEIKQEETYIKQEPESMDVITVQEEETDEPMPDIKEEPTYEDVKEEPIIEEPLVSGGLAATLALLNQKGMIAKPTEEQIKRDKIAAEQIRWQNEQRKKEHRRALEEQKEKERRRDHGRGRDHDRDRMRELEREREREREREEAQRMKEFELAMQNYKPEVNLEYTDNKGRVLKTAEAFRFMSHQFHGKTSGKTKTEKRMRKIEEERRLNMMSSTDTPLNLAGALLERQQRTGSAHVVLS
ncbi:hypothetical protein G6F35_003332 [Rhizopus arrhizus]|nr:hypothetical protein G6F35_003332 [Rhizopus arrhizus]